MPLFRKKSQSQARRLASWRSEALSGRAADDGLGPLLEELGARASREKQGWAVEVGGGRLFVTTIERGSVLSGYLQVEDTHDPGALATLLQRNLEPRLTWAALGDAHDGPLGVRFALPLDGFDRHAVLLALEALGDDDLSSRAREARDRPRGEAAEQQAHARAAEATAGALDAVRLPAEPGDKPGSWRIAADRGPIEAVLRDTGESLLLMHQLEYAAGDDNPEVLRWLLLASDWGSARLGLAPLPGGPGLFAACAIPAHALEPQALAWAVSQVVALGDDYDERAG
jgi:hypothetical protein